jgi:hypothetical protein
MDVGSKQNAVSFRVNSRQRQIKKGVQIGAEEKSVFDGMVFRTTVGVNMSGFQQFDDCAIGDSATGLEVSEQCGAKRRLALPCFNLEEQLTFRFWIHWIIALPFA